MRITKPIIIKLLFAFICISLSIYIGSNSVRVSNSKITLVNKGIEREVEALSGYHERSKEESKNFKWSFDLEFRKGDNAQLRLVVDDCIKSIIVNDVIFINLGKWDKKELCNISEGMVIDFANYLNIGSNKIEIYASDKGGVYGVKYIIPVGPVSSDQVRLILLILPILILWERYFIRNLIASKNHKLSWAALFYTGCSLFLYRFMLVSPYEHSYDLSYGHMQYISYLLNNMAIPSTNECWECYQPPVYYLLAFAAHRISDISGFVQPMYSLKILGLFIYLIIINLMIALTALLKLNKKASLLAFSMFIVWPLGVVKATDINNDMLVSMLVLCSIYYATKFYLKPKYKYFLFAILSGSVSILVKANGIVAPLILCMTVILLLIEKRKRVSEFGSAKYILTFLVFISIGLSHIIYRDIISEHDKGGRPLLVYQTLEGSKSLWFQEDKISYYTQFPIITHLQEPFFNTRDDNTGRHYFWSVFLRSALFGEFSFSSRNIAIGLNVTVLAMLIILFSAALSKVPNKESASIGAVKVYIITSVMLVGMLLSYRVYLPSSSNQDVRFIYPIVPLFCILYGYAIDRYWEQGKIKTAYLGGMLGVVFIILSVLFTINNYWDRF